MGVMNQILGSAVIGQPEPVIGMGVTILSFSDRHPGTIVGVEKLKNGKIRVKVQGDNYKVVKGSTMDGSAEYEISPNPNGSVKFFIADNANARWFPTYFKSETNRWRTEKYGGLRLGVREAYYDPHF